MTTTVAAGRLPVPGGELYHECRGSGPLVLVIGQPMTAQPFAALAEVLATDHTVVTYDPHGLGRSTAWDPSLPVTPEVHADELALLIAHLGGGPADVFGSSGGAVSGLALAARHPQLVRTLVAHEPPLTDLLPDGPHIRAVVDGTVAAFEQHGSGAGWGSFVALVTYEGELTGPSVPPASWPPPGQQDEAAQAPTPPEPSAKQQADDALFFVRALKPLTRYQPDVAALRAAAPRVLVGVGATGGDGIAVRSARALADRLGVPPTVFPGDHGGFMADPQGFAAVLRPLLAPPA